MSCVAELKIKIKISLTLFIEERLMWYFAWILGVLLACSFGIINAMWLESTENMDRPEDAD